MFARLFPVLAVIAATYPLLKLCMTLGYFLTGASINVGDLRGMSAFRFLTWSGNRLAPLRFIAVRARTQIEFNRLVNLYSYSAGELSVFYVQRSIDKFWDCWKGLTDREAQELLALAFRKRSTAVLEDYCRRWPQLRESQVRCEFLNLAALMSRRSYSWSVLFALPALAQPGPSEVERARLLCAFAAHLASRGVDPSVPLRSVEKSPVESKDARALAKETIRFVSRNGQLDPKNPDPACWANSARGLLDQMRVLNAVLDAKPQRLYLALLFGPVYSTIAEAIRQGHHFQLIFHGTEYQNDTTVAEAYYEVLVITDKGTPAEAVSRSRTPNESRWVRCPDCTMQRFNPTLWPSRYNDEIEIHCETCRGKGKIRAARAEADRIEEQLWKAERASIDAQH